MKPKVSVIVPVYGVEQYVERCVTSLFRQTLSDMEFIFVDDCTPDNSIEIIGRCALSYPQRASQIKIVRHDVNKGLPYARQTGLKEATADYVMHCDSDDWIELTMCEEMYNLAKEEDSDMVCCDFYYHNGEKIIGKRSACQSTTHNTLFVDILTQNASWNLWNKLCKRALYQNHIVFPEKAMGEDMLLSAQLVYYSKKISHLNKCLYNYYVDANRIQKEDDIDKVMTNYYQLKDNSEKLISFVGDKISDSNLLKNLTTYRRFQLCSVFYPAITEMNVNKLWRQVSPSIFELLNCPFISLQSKVLAVLRLSGLPLNANFSRSMKNLFSLIRNI